MIVTGWDHVELGQEVDDRVLLAASHAGVTWSEASTMIAIGLMPDPLGTTSTRGPASGRMLSATVSARRSSSVACATSPRNLSSTTPRGVWTAHEIPRAGFDVRGDG